MTLLIKAADPGAVLQPRTYSITVSCDGVGCSNSLAFMDHYDQVRPTLARQRWIERPDHSFRCPGCLDP